MDLILNALFPMPCAGCGARALVLCDRCVAAAPGPDPAPPPEGISSWVAPFAYEGAIRELVARVKYRDERHAVRWLAARAAEHAAMLEPPDLVTWIPTSPARLRERGFDHAKRLARIVATANQCRYLAVFDRHDVEPQTQRHGAVRFAGPSLGLKPMRTRTVEGIRSLWLVDDVATTGASLRAAAAVVHSVMPLIRIDAITVARTPAAGRSERCDGSSALGRSPAIRSTLARGS